MANTAASGFSGIATWAALASGDLFPFIDISGTGAAKNSIATAAELVSGLNSLGLAKLTTNTFTGAQTVQFGTAPDVVTAVLSASATSIDLTATRGGSYASDNISARIFAVGTTGAVKACGYRLEARNVTDTDYALLRCKGGQVDYDGTKSIGAANAAGSQWRNYINKGDTGTITLASTGRLSWTTGDGDAAEAVGLCGAGSNILQIGLDAAGVAHQHFKACNRITSDGVGANLTLSGGNGRGGAGGALLFSTYSTAGAATAGTLTTRLTLDTSGLLTFADAVDMAFNTTTGTKIGTASTQKIGFFGVTPVAQASGSTVNNIVSSGAGAVVLDDTTFDGGSGAVYTIGGLVASLKAIGIIG